MKLKEQYGTKYLDEGKGEPMVLLHGLFGALSNWETVIGHFSSKYRVIIPILPIFDLPVRTLGLEKLNEFLEGFIDKLDIGRFHLLGNSLGGHLALIYNLRNADNVKSMTLTGSSGLFEDGMGGSYPKRGSYDFVKERVEYTFYDPKTATKELISEVFETTKSIPKCLSIVAMAKSAQRNNLADQLPKIKTKTLLIWGLNDTITPPHVAHSFANLLPNSTLRFIDKCCHAPMMEHPQKFNWYLEEFLVKCA